MINLLSNAVSVLRMHWLAAPLLAGCLWTHSAGAQDELIDRLSAEGEAQVIAWRRDFHEHPELSNREFRTSEVVAEALRDMGLEVETGIAHTGVVAYLRGARERPLVAIRADMDALPVTEVSDLPFASTVKAEYRGQEVGVMHACGHDTHMAMVLGVARNLVAMGDELPGAVLFIFQPAEEGAPEGEEGGAELMLKEGLFERYAPDAVFGMHSFSNLNTGEIGYRAGPILASVDQFQLTVHGRQTHGARAELRIDELYPVTANDPELTQRMLPTIERVVGRERMIEAIPRTGAEDFSFFALEVPGLYLGLGVTPSDVDPATAPTNHSPLFFADEAALMTGVRVLSHLAVDYMAGN